MKVLDLQTQPNLSSSTHFFYPIIALLLDWAGCGPRSDDNFLPEEGAWEGMSSFSRAISAVTPPASPEKPAWVSKQPHKTLIPSSDFLI